MANKNIFKSASKSTKAQPIANTRNLAGGLAYAMEDKHALAQFAVTGTFSNTFYATAESQLEELKKLVNKVEPEFLAKLAVYSRHSAYMKDMPAFLLATLAAKDIELFKKTFPLVMDNAKMLRNFVQVVRSGVTGRKNFGSAPRRAIQSWLEQANDYQIFAASVGNDPSLADIIKMLHPRPSTKTREALYAYIMGKKHEASELPSFVQEFEAFKASRTAKVAASSMTAVADAMRKAGYKVEAPEIPSVNLPKVPFQMLTALPLTSDDWKSIANNAAWQMTRMNLNTFARHGVFQDKAMTKKIADRLRDEKAIEKAKAFPYQLFAAYLNVDDTIPESVKNALQDAMEIAIRNVPRVDGKIYVGVDISGSMDDSVTGRRAGSTSKVSCRQVAALIASAIKRHNEDTEVYVFDTSAKKLNLNGRDSVMTNAQKIAKPGGGTDCSCFVAKLNEKKKQGDLVILVSDNESWHDRPQYNWVTQRSTGLMTEWATFKQRSPNAKLVCIDLTPNTTVQATNSTDRLNVGGFSDNVFNVVAQFANGKGSADFWTSIVENFQPKSPEAGNTEE